MPKSTRWSIKRHDYTRIDEIEQNCRDRMSHTRSQASLVWFCYHLLVMIRFTQNQHDQLQRKQDGRKINNQC